MNPKKPVITRRDFVRGSAVAAGAGLTGILKPSGNAAPVDEDELWRVFHEPPISARPFVRWWWNGDKVTAKEILRELDVMKTAGIGGFELNPIRAFQSDLAIIEFQSVFRSHQAHIAGGKNSEFPDIFLILFSPTLEDRDASLGGLDGLFNTGQDRFTFGGL